MIGKILCCLAVIFVFLFGIGVCVVKLLFEYDQQVEENIEDEICRSLEREKEKHLNKSIN